MLLAEKISSSARIRLAAFPWAGSVTATETATTDQMKEIAKKCVPILRTTFSAPPTTSAFRLLLCATASPSAVAERTKGIVPTCKLASTRVNLRSLTVKMVRTLKSFENNELPNVIFAWAYKPLMLWEYIHEIVLFVLNFRNVHPNSSRLQPAARLHWWIRRSRMH